MTEYEFEPKRLTVKRGATLTVAKRRRDRPQPHVEQGPNPRGSQSWPAPSSFLPGRSETLRRRPSARPLHDGLHGPGPRELGMVGTLQGPLTPGP